MADRELYYANRLLKGDVQMAKGTDRELLELIANQVGNLTYQVDGLTNQVRNLTNDVSEIKGDVSGLKGDVSGLKLEVENIKEIVVRLEVDHGQKLNALFDGYVQNSEKLDRIEAEVAKHEEFILKRIK